MSHWAILGIMDIQNLHFKKGVIKRKKEPEIRRESDKYQFGYDKLREELQMT